MPAVLQRKSKASAKEIASQADVSERQIRRILSGLEDEGKLITGTGLPAGYDRQEIRI